MAMAKAVNILEHCQVAPPPGTVSEQSLPLTFFDLAWLHFPLVHRVLFYDFPHSKSEFIEAVIPNVKHSASLALKRFFPMAGNLIIPLESGKPVIHYVDGNSVSMIIAESSNDYNYITGNNPRNADEFHPLVPRMPEAIYLSAKTVVPLLALQVTHFPNSGLCLGLTFHHAIADASALMNFLRSWASITKSGGDEEYAGDKWLPFYDRTAIEDLDGLEDRIWGQLRGVEYKQSQVHDLAFKKVRATFIMCKVHAQGLKNLVLAQRPKIPYVSTFTVTCAYVWTCLLKLRKSDGEEICEDELDHFVCALDCRARLKPPIPAAYFGNCIAPVLVGAKSAELMGEQGFLAAAELIGEAIHERLYNKEGVLAGLAVGTWLVDIMGLKRERLASVSASPKLDFYGVDFGWGRPRKIEIISTDITEAFSLIECRDSKADVEIGLSIPSVKVNTFTNVFADGLKNL